MFTGPLQQLMTLSEMARHHHREEGERLCRAEAQAPPIVAPGVPHERGRVLVWDTLTSFVGRLWSQARRAHSLTKA